MTKHSKRYYIAKVKLLTEQEIERLLSRMGTKLDRRVIKQKVSQAEALATQMELEDEQLQHWREVRQAIKISEAKKSQEKNSKKNSKGSSVEKGGTPPKSKAKAATVVTKAKASKKS